MRIGCSPLRNDLFTQLKVVPTPICACGGGIENAIHYFYDCNLYNNQRQQFMDELYTVGTFTIATLLYGDMKYSAEINAKFVNCVHKYYESTGRFSQ